MKKLINSKFGYGVLISGIFILNIILWIIVFSLRITDTYGAKSVWDTASLYVNKNNVAYFSVAFIACFCLGILLHLGALVLLFIRKIKWGLLVSSGYQLLFVFFLLFTHIYYKMLRVSAVVFLVLNILLTVACFVFLLTEKISGPKEECDAESVSTVSKRLLLVLNTVCFILVFSVFFVPLYSYTTDSFQKKSYFLISALSSAKSEVSIYIVFISLFLLVFADILVYASLLPYYFKEERRFIAKGKYGIYFNLFITTLFFIIGYFISFYLGIIGKKASTISYIPLLLMIPVLLIFSVLQGKYGIEIPSNKDSVRKYRLEPLFFVGVFTAITFVSLCFNIIEVKFTFSSYSNTIKMDGYQLLTNYTDLGAGYQLLAFILFAFLFTSLVLFVLSVVSLLGRYKDYYKVIKTSVYANVIFMLLIGLSGVYFKISQKINEDNINSLLEYYHISAPEDYAYKIQSQTLYVFLFCLVVLAVMILRGQLNHSLEERGPEREVLEPSKPKPEEIVAAPAVQPDFDACPAFTELDYRRSTFAEELAKRKEAVFENPTLPGLVRFIVDYARESRLHLSYSTEDIATFVAGLGASRLSILQGMSGTGKTSLPKIFIEAVMGNCEIIEVESSWRDKNELLGYYNEFSRSYTPKKFTQCLYKAKLNPEVPTFIVLDEMNLSRIEYYFSDFLSLMEHEEDKREIKLLNVKLYRSVNGEKIPYYALTDGHTLRIPSNVWFIGTANRDESTFEISDKVYDRAQTMNFNKRAPKIHSFSQELSPKFLPYETLAELLKRAKEEDSFDAEDNAIIQKVEKLLAPYNISFGNRVLKQMEDFVKIYCACFGDKEAVRNEAVERIVLSKVISKLEYKVVEDKERLATEFDKLNLSLCSAFVRKLNED